MTKHTITTVFVGSMLAMGGGLVLLFLAGVLALASGNLVYNGPDIVGVQENAFGWTMITVAAVGGLVMIGGALGQLVAWSGAVLNAAGLEDKVWFAALLVLGLLSFGLIATLAYVIAGPDGAETVSARRGFPARPAPTA